MRTSALFGAKNAGFFKIYGVSARTRGGQFFAILCGRLLWTAPYRIKCYSAAALVNLQLCHEKQFYDFVSMKYMYD